MNPIIAVIGAGISGLSAAYELKRAGFKPVILEKESFVGGRMSSELVDGFVVEKAAYTFPEFHRSLTSFLHEMGMEHALVQTPGTSSTFIRGKEYQIKIGSPTDFLRYKLLSVKNKKDMVKLFLYAKSMGKHLNLVRPSEKSFELERVSTAEYLLRDYDEEILEYVADPMFCEIFLGRPENNSKLAFLATISNLARFKIFSFDTGMGMLPERMMRDLDVRLDSPVTSIRSKARGEPYEVNVGGHRPESFHCDGIIFAIPSPLVPTICDELPETVKEILSQVPYAPSIVTAFAVDKTYPGTSLINNLARKDFDVVGTVVFDHHKGPNHVPEGKELVTAVLREQASRTLLEESEERIVNAALKDLDALFPGLSNTVRFSRVYRWEFGAVQLPPGSLFKHYSARKHLEAQFDDLSFAGDGLYKSSLEVSFNSGISAARHIIKNLGPSGSRLTND